MKRRKFLAASAAGLAGSTLLGSLQPLQAMMKNNSYVQQIGLQLYTVREQMQADFEGTMKAIKEAGYWQVESDSMMRMPQLLPVAKDLGLQVKCSHFLWPHITGNWEFLKKMGMPVPPDSYTFEKLVEDASKNGIEYLIFAYLPKNERETLDQYKNLIEQLNKAGETCKQAGVKLCYHNHAFEFEPTGGQVPYDLMIEQLEPGLVNFELDVFWASLAGHDPVKLMKKMAGRIRLLHLKDKLAGTPEMFDERKVPENAYKELGNGVINIEKILKSAKKVDVAHCMVEQDQSPDPLASIKTSNKWLKAL